MESIPNIEDFLQSTLDYLNDKKRFVEKGTKLTNTQKLSNIIKDVKAVLEEVSQRTHCNLCIFPAHTSLSADDTVKRLSKATTSIKEVINTKPSVDYNLAPFKPINVADLNDIDAYSMSFTDMQKFLAQHHDCSEFQSSEAVGTDLDEGDWSRLQQCAVQDAVRCYSYVAEDRGDSIQDVADAVISFVQDIKDCGGFNNYPDIKAISTKDCLEDR